MMMNKNNRIQGNRGFTLLIAIILSTVALVVGLALADVAYKQVVLSSTARNSQIAFYRADSAMECALYWDQQFASFSNATSPMVIQCENRNITVTKSAFGESLISTFDVPCATGGRSASVTVYKQGTGVCAPGKKTCIYVSGFNSCSTTDPNRFERGLKVKY